MNPAELVIRTLKEQEAMHLLPSIIKDLEQELYRNQDIHVTVATALSKTDDDQLHSALTEKWGEHRIILTTDPTILSGMIIAFNGTIVDSSGRSNLATLQQTLNP